MAKSPIETKKANHRQTNLDYVKIFTDKGPMIEKLPGNLNIGPFKLIPKGNEVVADIINGYISGQDGANILIEQGVTTGITGSNIGHHIRRIKKEIGYNPSLSVIYVPFLTKATSTKYLAELQGKIQHYEEEGKGYRKNKNLSSVAYKVDPILGLHALVLELDSFQAVSKIGFKEYISLISTKSAIYEKIYKLDNESRNKVDRIALVQKLDRLAQFISFLHTDLAEMLIETESKLKKISDFIGNPMITKNIEQILYDIEININIKQIYLDYAKKIDVETVDMEAVTESDIIED